MFHKKRNIRAWRLSLEILLFKILKHALRIPLLYVYTLILHFFCNVREGLAPIS
jgi:hypothetical protein